MDLTLTELLQIEKDIQKFTLNIQKEITEELSKTINPDYKPINNICGIVRFSALKDSESWSPEYFIPKAQAEIVAKKLNCTTISSLHKTIDEMITTKKVKINNNTYVLNPITIKVLKKYYKGE